MLYFDQIELDTQTTYYSLLFMSATDVSLSIASQCLLCVEYVSNSVKQFMDGRSKDSLEKRMSHLYKTRTTKNKKNKT